MKSKRDVFNAMVDDMKAAVVEVGEKHYGKGSRYQDDIYFDVIAVLGLLLSQLIAAIPGTEKRRDATEMVVNGIYETVARQGAKRQ
jgi:hypothetical protein